MRLLIEGSGSEAGRRWRLLVATLQDYATLDLPRLWAELPHGLELLERYVQALATFLGAAAPR